MKVFASRFLEPMEAQHKTTARDWSWQPANSDVVRIYASGASTKSRESTYADDRDNRGDEDRPNEGHLIA